MVMIAAALAAAVLYGAGTAMEQRQAAAAPQSSAGRLRLVLVLARQPLWLAGIAMQAGGLAAHAVALRAGPLAAVQVLMSAELIVAVVIMRVWSGRRLSRGSWTAALTVIVAVAVFLLAVSPGHDHVAGQPRSVAAALGAATTGAAALAAAAAGLRAAGLRAAGRRRAVLLAVAAGLADSCSAVVTMAVSHAVAGHGLAALATSWSGYALVVCGAGNVLLTQFAYQAGRPMLTLPVIAAVTPLASVAVGAGLLGEAPGTGAAGAATAGAAVLVTSLALAYLARSVPHPGTGAAGGGGQVAPVDSVAPVVSVALVVSVAPVVSVTEKALPSGSRKANIAGTPGQRRMSSVSTPAAESAACAATASPVVNRMPMAPRVVAGAAGSRVTITLPPPGASSIQRPPLGVGLSRSMVKPSVPA